MSGVIEIRPLGVGATRRFSWSAFACRKLADEIESVTRAHSRSKRTAAGPRIGGRPDADQRFLRNGRAAPGRSFAKSDHFVLGSVGRKGVKGSRNGCDTGRQTRG